MTRCSCDPTADGDCAIIGGYVYRGSVIPNFYGAYVYSDECTGELRAVVQSGGHVTQSKDLGLNVAQTTTFGEGLGGELYVGVAHRNDLRARVLRTRYRSRARLTAPREGAVGFGGRRGTR